jgi:hypothetical protein
MIYFIVTIIIVNILIAFYLFPFVSIYFVLLFCHTCVPGSSVSIVSGYGLNDRANEVRSPAEARGYFLYPVCPDRLCGPPSFLSSGYWGSFARG